MTMENGKQSLSSFLICDTLLKSNKLLKLLVLEIIIATLNGYYSLFHVFYLLIGTIELNIIEYH